MHTSYCISLHYFTQIETQMQFNCKSYFFHYSFYFKSCLFWINSLMLGWSKNTHILFRDVPVCTKGCCMLLSHSLTHTHTHAHTHTNTHAPTHTHTHTLSLSLSLSPIKSLLPAHGRHSPLTGHVLLVVVHALSQLQDTVREILINVLTPHIWRVFRHRQGEENCKTDTSDHSWTLLNYFLWMDEGWRTNTLLAPDKCTSKNDHICYNLCVK